MGMSVLAIVCQSVELIQKKSFSIFYGCCVRRLWSVVCNCPWGYDSLDEYSMVVIVEYGMEVNHFIAEVTKVFR